MRATQIAIAIILMLIVGDPASAGLSKHQFQKLKLDGFHLGMSLAETDVTIRARVDIEEPSSELFRAFNCGALLPNNSDGEYEQLQNRRHPISYYIDDHTDHRYDLFFESTPAGTHIYTIYYFDFLPDDSWTAHLAYARERYGKPDIVRANGPHMSAIWCERGDKKCDSDDFRQRLVLNWNPDQNQKVRGFSYMVWEKAHRYDGGDEDEYAAIAKQNPAKGRLLFRQCMDAAGTFADAAEMDGHLGNLVGGLANWSSAISEPRLIDSDLLKAAGFEAEGLISRHNCAIRRQAGHSDLKCGNRSEFRWMRSKGPLSLFALRDISTQSHRTRTGTLSNERRYYCVVSRENSTPRIAWAGESLIDLQEWLKSYSGEHAGQAPMPSCLPEL